MSRRWQWSLVLGALLLSTGCASTEPNRSPVGERFPSVHGSSLDGKDIALPDFVAGAPALLLVGYAQNAQFDADRWLLGLGMAEVNVRVLEVPTIPGLFPGLFSGAISDGMRRGIPEEDWATVVTVFGDGDAIAKFTGNESPNNIRVILLDQEGRVTWFHDHGYSARLMLELRNRLGTRGGPG